MEKILLGQHNKKDVYKIILKNDQAEATLISYGAALQGFIMKDKNGVKTDVILGFDSPDNFDKGVVYMGAAIGRVSNRISGGKFSLNGKEYSLAINDCGVNTLHGGTYGFDTHVFDIKGLTDDSVSFYTESPDGEENFPGNVKLTVTYTLNGTDINIDFEAESDADTLMALTNHAYFNLNGQGKGTVENHMLKVYADDFTPINDKLQVGGEVKTVKGTPFDFTEYKEIGKEINADDDQLKFAGGYDHNFCLKDDRAASLYSPETGIKLDVYANYPGAQVYTGNFLAGEVGKGTYIRRGAVCIEPQFYPNAINVPSFTQPVLKKGEVYKKYIRYCFGLK